MSKTPPRQGELDLFGGNLQDGELGPQEVDETPELPLLDPAPPPPKPTPPVEPATVVLTSAEAVPAKKPVSLKAMRKVSGSRGTKSEETVAGEAVKPAVPAAATEPPSAVVPPPSEAPPVPVVPPAAAVAPLEATPPPAADEPVVSPVTIVAPPSVAPEGSAELPAPTATKTTDDIPVENQATKPHAPGPIRLTSRKTDPVAAQDHPVPAAPARPARPPLRITGHAGHPPSRGQLLQEARVRCDLSIEQVALATKIKLHFLEALERDDAEHLPPEVYVKAYVRRLCHHYGLDENEVLALAVAPPPKAVDKSIPQEILQHIEEGKQVNPQEERKIRRLQWAAAAAVLIVTLAAGFWFWQSQQPEANVSGQSAPTVPGSIQQDAASALEIAGELAKRCPPAPPLVLSELPIPGRR